MKFCRVCGSGDMTPLWDDFGGNAWSRCVACGSDTSGNQYPSDLYTDDYLTKSLAKTGGMEAAREQVRSNIDWLNEHRGAGRDYLDIGCLEGASLDVAAGHGWSVHGWDRIEAARRPGCTTITPFFAASFMPQLYDAVFCKDVLEHVPSWRGFLSEVTAVLHRNGLLQLQTPRPMPRNCRHCYQPAHLVIFNPATLELALRELGYRVLDKKFWDGTDMGPAGQAYMLQLTDKPG